MVTRKLSAADEQRRKHALLLLARMIADAIRKEQREATDREAAREPAEAVLDQVRPPEAPEAPPR